MKVSKFGGTSLSNASQVRKVLAIIRLDQERQYIVVSAPGKRNPPDQKITDLLYQWHRQHQLRLSTNEIRQIISDRYAEIVNGLGLSFDLAGELAEVNRKINDGASADFAASRGEYLMGKIMALALGTVLEANGISFEHMPSGIDTLSIVIDDRQFSGDLDEVAREIKEECSPDTIEIFPEMAMIAVVGRAMIRVPGVAAKVFAALADKGINIRMINQGSSEISIIIGAENADYENAVRAIYGAFMK